MKTPPDPKPAKTLRQAAEAKQQAHAGNRPPQTEADLRRLQHELEVHQIELEMQNEELRGVRAELEASLDRYTDLFDFAPVSYFNLAKDGRIQMANLTGALLLGVERGQLLRRSFGAFVSAADRPAFGNFLQQVFAGGARQVCELRLVNQSGSPMTGLLKARLAPDGGECLLALVDITERKQAERALLEKQKLLAETGRIGHVGGWEFDIATGQQTWTQAVYDIHEVSEDFRPSVAQGINFYTPASRPIIERAVQRAIELGEPYDLELEMITAKGNRREVHTIGHADLARGKVSGFFQDITASKRAEAALRASEATFRAVADLSPMAIYASKGSDQKALFINKAFHEMFGYSLADTPTVGQWWLKAFPDEKYR